MGKTILIACSIFWVILCDSPTIAQKQSATSSSAVAARIADLSPPDKNLPDNEIVLADEVRGINEELASNRADLATYDRSTKELEEAKLSINKFLQDVEGLNCDSPSPATLRELLNTLEQLKTSLSDPFSAAPNPWDTLSIGDTSNLASKDLCQKLRDLVSARRQALLSFMEAQLKELADKKNEISLLIGALEKRRAALADHMKAASTKRDIFGYLWRLIAVIGAFSIGTILIIRFFSPELQVQWVASGQVIQFVTVMILLSVIMALGLASILREETLGTLLGGIAGYVLSQGVGRAAALAVSQGLGLGRTGGSLGGSPTITSIQPNTGPAAGGTRVTIAGTGFAQGCSVSFGGIPGTVLTVTETSIEATTPQHPAGPVDFVVTQDGRSTTLASAFTYI